MSDTKTKLRGVNLGGWLVLEKWMTPSLFTGLKAGDEFGLCEELGPKEASDILRIHRNNFITELDFKWIADRGLNAVRLPVGYWILGNSKPYVGGIEYVDKALDWAEQYGIKVIIDLHGAPGSQNGKDHSGRIGAIGWHKEGNIDRTLKALEELCKRYAGVPCVVGIELLNEPAWKLGKKRLAAYYEQGYKIVRKQMGADTMVIFPDAFRPKRWKRVLRGDEFQNVVMDAHLYQVFSRSDKRLSAFRHLGKAADRAGLIRKLQKVRPVIIGEWSTALPQLAVKQMATSPHLSERAYGDVQLMAQHEALGWFYWSYKTESGGVWSFQDCVHLGILPTKYDI
jgi:glucan 1,3-beta-glucosidase